MSPKLKHGYHFDPSYGYSVDKLLRVSPGSEPEGFASFWQKKYQQAQAITPYLSLQDTGQIANNWRIFDCYYDSTEGVRIAGWLLLPQEQEVKQAVVWVHGYGGIDQPDTSWKLLNTALLVPCIRGISRSAVAPFSSEPNWHVLHDIQDKERYILGGCVQDIWCSINALTSLFPQVSNKVGLIGSSFGGGLSVFAAAFDTRIQRCHFHVPTFGNPEVRMQLETVGATQSLREFAMQHPALIEATLPYFDASCAARYLTQPSLWALALFDPMVAPPGQFSIYNNCAADKNLFTLDAGHFIYVGEGKQRRELRQHVEQYFSTIGEKYAS